MTTEKRNSNTISVPSSQRPFNHPHLSPRLKHLLSFDFEDNKLHLIQFNDSTWLILLLIILKSSCFFWLRTLLIFFDKYSDLAFLVPTLPQSKRKRIWFPPSFYSLPKFYYEIRCWNLKKDIITVWSWFVESIQLVL